MRPRYRSQTGTPHDADSRQVERLGGWRASSQRGRGGVRKTDRLLEVSCHRALAQGFASEADVVVRSHEHQALAACVEFVMGGETKLALVVEHQHFPYATTRGWDRLLEFFPKCPQLLHVQNGDVIESRGRGGVGFGPPLEEQQMKISILQCPHPRPHSMEPPPWKSSR